MSAERVVLRGYGRDGWAAYEDDHDAHVEVIPLSGSRSKHICVRVRARMCGGGLVQISPTRADFIEAVEKALNVVVIEGSEIDAIPVEAADGLPDHVRVDGGLYARSSGRHAIVLRNLAAERWFAAHPGEPSPAARTLVAKMRAAGVDVNVAQAEDLLSRGVRP